MDMQRVGSPAPVRAQAEGRAQDKAAAVDMEVEAALATPESGDEEHKEHEKASSSDSSSDSDSTEGEPEDDAMVDGSMPATQVLAEDGDVDKPADKPAPAWPANVSPKKTAQSPLKRVASPKKVTYSPAKRVASPKKAASTPTKLFASPKKASPKKASPKKSLSSPAKAVASASSASGEFHCAGPVGHFTQTFAAVAEMLEASGWQFARGPNTLLCAMPGVQFFNFKPNINVFDTKLKACWKFIALAGAEAGETTHAALWELLWPVAQRVFGWFTMQCGPETWFVKPDTQFQAFEPNETIFQTKKRAVLKCLALEVGEIELGDSMEGHQTIAFAPRPPKKAAKKPAASSKPVASSNKPVKAAATAVGAKRQLPASSGKSAGKKKVKGDKKKKAAPRRKKPAAGPEATGLQKAEVFHFSPPEFRCTFGLVYARLQQEGWHHRTGAFEYDYFSPTYSKETEELNVNYFRSVADLEQYLKVSGVWRKVEDELRDEHEEVVEELREEALEKHHRQLEKNEAARKKKQAAQQSEAAPPQAVEAPKKAAKKKASKKKSKSESKKAVAPVMPTLEFAKLSMGAVVDKLKKRGWFYRPGRFEYDYFKPNTNLKSAVSGEDRFESLAALEEYLKTSGLWHELARELEDDRRLQELEDEAEAQEKKAAQDRAAASRPLVPPSGAHKEEVKALTNDIWANSHEFEFNE